VGYPVNVDWTLAIDRPTRRRRAIDRAIDRTTPSIDARDRSMAWTRAIGEFSMFGRSDSAVVGWTQK